MNGLAERILSLGVKATVTASANGTSIDNLASSANGGVFYWHVLAATATGGNAQWKIRLEESSNDGGGDAFADTHSTEQVIANGVPTSGKVTFTGTLEQYVRQAIELDATSGSLTVLMGHVRN